ncbi:MAG: bifunctional oligoribonuclease/PAP phosphatase NrnA [Endomicrobiales bacterium]|nr:bifunctional oligoribonuclease/PAP phosphatase NrnA [Endomicrobiales bacterium]
MKSDLKNLARIEQAISKSRTFFIAGHVKPDGDTVGSALALSSLLKRLGKKCEVFSAEGIPEYLMFLKGADRIKISKKAEGHFDCAIILECSDLERMGGLIEPSQAGILINIDHHAFSSEYGDINLLDPGASSSAEQVFFLFRHMKKDLTCHEAEALYVGIVTDTGKFQQTNTTAKALTVAAELLKNGVKPFKVYEKLYATQTLSSLRLLGGALATLEVTASGKVAHMHVTKDMYEKAGSGAAETEGIINYSMMIPGVLVGVLLRENGGTGGVKASLRSREGIDVNNVAKRFGGGGHKTASGCTIMADLPSAKKALLEEIARNIGEAGL